MNDLPEQATETTTANEPNGGGTAPIVIEAPESACPLERLDELDRRIELLLKQRDEIDRGLEQLAEPELWVRGAVELKDCWAGWD
jgi:hypothetical protein